MKIDPEFKGLIPPLSKEEYTQLEANILAEGCRDALVVWGDTLIDGHNRYEICTRHGIPFKTAVREFRDRAEVRQWIISNQLGRRNLTPEKFAYMIGKLYEERKQDGFKGNQHTDGGSPQNGEKQTTAEKIADEYRVGKNTVERAATFSKAVDTISKNLGEEAKDKILNRDIDVTRQEVIRLAQLNPVHQKVVFEQLEQDDGAICRIPTKTTAQLLVSSNSNEWYTPARYIEAARRVMGGIDVDPATCPEANETVKAGAIFTAESDGLLHDWPGRVWLNPPYGGLTEEFTAKLLDQYRRGITTEAVLLVNSHATDTKWFQPLWDHILCFTDHRVNFVAPGGSEGTGSTHGSVFVYLGPHQNVFAQEFSQFGAIVRRYAP